MRKKVNKKSPAKKVPTPVLVPDKRRSGRGRLRRRGRSNG